VKQSEVLVPARGSATFDVTIALDIDEVPFGERYDFITQLAVWRRTSHSCEPWGGCSVIVEPRLESTCTAHVASWLRGHDLNLEGTVPGATGGQVTVEAYLSTEQGPEVRFSQASLTHTGDWAGAIPAADATYAEVRAHFDGNSVLARSDSPTLNASPKDIA